MVTFHCLVISIFSLMLLLTKIDASQHRSVRQKRAACTNLAGNMCGFVICENGGICYEDPNTPDCFTCQCPPGYTGKVCDTSITILPVGCNPGCQNGGTCNFNVCQCLSGYSGTFCEIRDYCSPSNPCQNGGRCTSTGTSYLCDCNGTGYDGIICTNLIPTNPCLSSPCQNGGQCSWDGSNLDCICINSYSGPYCQIAPIPCVATPCQNGGTCQLLGTNTYGCVCPVDYTGAQCETFVLATHPCVIAPATTCRNGGVCTRNGANYICICAAGWSGTNCEIQGSTSSCNPDPCGAYGTCFEINLPIGATVHCSCQSPWTGKYCDVNMDVPCAGYCLSGGVCQMSGNAPYCTCPSLYTGQRCESYTGGLTTTTTLTPVTCAGYCLSGGVCQMFGPVPYCDCPPLYTGERCESYMGGLTTTLSPVVTLCAVNPCVNGGTCYTNNNIYECACPPTWTGPTCAVPETIVTTTTLSPGGICSPNPCLNGGVCYLTAISFMCSCQPSYTGALCEIYQTTVMPPFTTTPGGLTTCAGQPCKNGGTCVPMGGSYSCFCGLTSIYTGKNCDTTTPMTIAECPLECAPGRCIFSGNPLTPYACLWGGVMRPIGGTTG